MGKGLQMLKTLVVFFSMLSVAAGAHANSDLAHAKNCIACHNISVKVIGPAFKDVAAKSAKGRIVSCLEGGYSLSALGRSVEAHLRVLADV